MQIKQVSVEFSGTIPTQAYGNISLKVRWNADLDGTESAESATQELFAKIRDEVRKAVEPIAKQRATSMEQALQGLPQNVRDEVMNKGGIFNFLAMITPELNFAANAKDGHHAD